MAKKWKFGNGRLHLHIGRHLVFSIIETNWNPFHHIPWVTKHINRHKKYISRCNDKENMVISIDGDHLGRHLEFCKMLKGARVASLGFWLRGSRWPRNRWKTSDIPKCTVHHWMHYGASRLSSRLYLLQVETFQYGGFDLELWPWPFKSW